MSLFCYDLERKVITTNGSEVWDIFGGISTLEWEWYESNFISLCSLPLAKNSFWWSFLLHVFHLISISLHGSSFFVDFVPSLMVDSRCYYVCLTLLNPLDSWSENFHLNFHPRISKLITTLFFNFYWNLSILIPNVGWFHALKALSSLSSSNGHLALNLNNLFLLRVLLWTIGLWSGNRQ